VEHHDTGDSVTPDRIPLLGRLEDVALRKAFDNLVVTGRRISTSNSANRIRDSLSQRVGSVEVKTTNRIVGVDDIPRNKHFHGR